MTHQASKLIWKCWMHIKSSCWFGLVWFRRQKFNDRNSRRNIHEVMFHENKLIFNKNDVIVFWVRTRNEFSRRVNSAFHHRQDVECLPFQHLAPKGHGQGISTYLWISEIEDWVRIDSPNLEILIRNVPLFCPSILPSCHRTRSLYSCPLFHVALH